MRKHDYWRTFPYCLGPGGLFVAMVHLEER